MGINIGNNIIGINIGSNIIGINIGNNSRDQQQQYDGDYDGD